MLRAKVCAYDFLHIFQTLHIRRILSFPSSHFLLFLPYYHPSGRRRRGAGLALDHRIAILSGSRAGGDPAREAAPEAGPGSPTPRLARPNPQCASRWDWYWGQGHWVTKNGRDGV